MLVRRRVSLTIKFDATHLYTWVERGTEAETLALAKEYNTISPAGLELTNLGRSALTMGPPHLPYSMKFSRPSLFLSDAEFTFSFQMTM